MTFYPLDAMQDDTSIDNAPLGQTIKPRNVTTRLTRFCVEFIFSAFPWIFLASYIVISIFLSLLYLAESQKY